MSIDFNILWFEDDEVWRDSIKEAITTFLDQQHFVPRIKEYSCDLSEEDFQKVKEEMGIFHLILTDYKLDGSYGTNVIKMLRSDHILSDIILYSSSGVPQLHEAMTKNVLEGIYVADRTQFILKVQQLIEKGIKRLESSPHMRSILINYVAENDLHIREALEKKRNEDKLQKKCEKVLSNYLKDITKKINECIKSSNCLEASLKETGLLDSDKLIRLYHKIIESPSFTVENYRKDILEIRNQYAHDKDKSLTSDECKNIREKMKSYRSDIWDTP